MEEYGVKTIWSEMVKPWNPTPCHLKTYRLSVLDQLSSLLHVPTLLFFSPTATDPHQLLMRMKASLSKALSQFYPLAGRLSDNSTLICDDQGALLIHTQVSCTLKSYFSLIVRSLYSEDDAHQQDQKLPLIKLLPPRDSLHGFHQHEPIPISAWVQLAFQVNVFSCGGVVIGCYMCHKLMDGISAATFLRQWASLCLGHGPDQLVRPNFDAIVAAFPPCDPNQFPDEATTTELRDEWLEETLQGTTTTTITLKAFVFKPTSISALKEQAASERIPNPSRIESVVGFLWKHSLQAEAEAEAGVLEGVGHTDLLLTVDMRRRVRPPLPWESMGNVATDVLARADKNGLGLADLVAEIRGAINEFNDETLRVFQGDKRGEALWEHRKMITQLVSSEYKPSTYRVSCLCHAGFKDVDFGFGKPIWISVLDGVMLPVLRNFIVLMDHIDLSEGAQGNGIEAWLILDKKEMQILETNPDFLAFATPLDLSLN